MQYNSTIGITRVKVRRPEPICSASPPTSSPYPAFEKYTSIYDTISNMENKEKSSEEMENKEKSSEESSKELSLNWVVILFHIYLHLLGIIGLYVLFCNVKWMTVFFFIFLVTISLIGLTAGAHRLYAHRTFTATSELRFFIMIAHTLAGVGSIKNWVFWHRIHHKYYGTDRDPYNHKKGFLFSHVYGNMLSSPSDLNTYAKTIDMSDIKSDGYVRTQHKFYWILFIVLGFMIPINIPIMYWNESLANSIMIMGITRLMITSNISWLVNSAMLVWGLKKGDRFPVEDNSIFFIWKSFWINYHYVIPWDWKSDEFGRYEKGFVTFIIKIWWELGLVKEMMTVSREKMYEVLYKVADSEITMDDALEKMKERATEDALKEGLMYYH